MTNSYGGTKIIMLLFVIFIAMAIGAVIFMILWNLIIAPLFGLPHIGFWVAFGLSFIFRVIFG